ncbi:MAG: FHA domain-containing protein [Tepidisphaeraceae bacterium]
MACLIITVGEPKDAKFSLDSCPLTAGRDTARDIQIIDPKVSRRHFTIKKTGNDYCVQELDAKNGVYVNGKKVSESALRDGDRILVGNTELTFLSSDDPGRIDALKKMRQLSPAAKAPTMV